MQLNNLRHRSSGRATLYVSRGRYWSNLGNASAAFQRRLRDDDGKARADFHLTLDAHFPADKGHMIKKKKKWQVDIFIFSDVFWRWKMSVERRMEIYPEGRFRTPTRDLSTERSNLENDSASFAINWNPRIEDFPGFFAWESISAFLRISRREVRRIYCQCNPAREDRSRAADVSRARLVIGTNERRDVTRRDGFNGLAVSEQRYCRLWQITRDGVPGVVLFLEIRGALDFRGGDLLLARLLAAVLGLLPHPIGHLIRQAGKHLATYVNELAPEVCTSPSLSLFLSYRFISLSRSLLPVDVTRIAESNANVAEALAGPEWRRYDVISSALATAQPRTA